MDLPFQQFYLEKEIIFCHILQQEELNCVFMSAPLSLFHYWFYSGHQEFQDFLPLGLEEPWSMRVPVYCFHHPFGEERT